MAANGSMMSEWKLRELMCEIGRRVYAKGFAAANDGNISYRLSEDRVLCTPTRVSKGFMKPDDLCIVDMDGKQVSGKRKRSSEILLHLAILKDAARRPVVRPLPPAARHGVRRRARADPQVHPPRVRGLPRRGGDRQVRDPRHAGVRRHGAPLRQGHRDDPAGQPRHDHLRRRPEDAYFKTEIIDAYCRILLLAKQLGTINYYSDAKAAELIKIKPDLGIPDPRLALGLENCDLCGNSLFREGYSRLQARAQGVHPRQVPEATGEPAARPRNGPPGTAPLRPAGRTSTRSSGRSPTRSCTR